MLLWVVLSDRSSRTRRRSESNGWLLKLYIYWTNLRNVFICYSIIFFSLGEIKFFVWKHG
jgi:hypothetical protein